MTRRSGGILAFRRRDGELEVLLVHPGGPFWARRDDGAWSIPKGEYGDTDDPLAAALREFEEELGREVPAGELMELGALRQPGGKVVTAWAVEGFVDTARIVSNTFDLEWPKGSGTIRQYPEVDRAAWFTVPAARVKILRGQAPFLDRLVALVGDSGSADPPTA
jgi:predicted NUDIX family NTP pyrophosphohydrolase